METHNRYFQETIRDLLEDFSLFQTILEQKRKEVTASQKTWDLPISVFLMETSQKIQETCKRFETSLKNNPTEETITDAIHQKYETEHLLRRFIIYAGAYLTAPNWQSPSFFQNLVDNAGRKYGEIRESDNDYTRDQHKEGNRYAQAFLREYVTHQPLLLVKAFCVSSGMAALTTLIHYVQSEFDTSRPVLLGKGSYFENKISIHHNFSRVIEVDEYDMSALEAVIKKEKPIAIFLDSLGNNPELTAPSLNKLTKMINSVLTSDFAIILDNTGTSITYQPFSTAVLWNPKLSFLCFESLNKYHQFGLDRVTGGILYGVGKNDMSLYDFRDHLGTNLSDISAATLPKPNRTILKKRLMRHERNAQLIANALEKHCSPMKGKDIRNVIYPGLSSHPGQTETGFHGSLITFSWKNTSVKNYIRLRNAVTKEAKKERVPLVGGTSFGLSVTRVYVPASRPGKGTPFFRIAVGTETKREIEELISVLTNAITESVR